MPKLPPQANVRALRNFLPADLRRRPNENASTHQRRVLTWLRRGVR